MQALNMRALKLAVVVMGVLIIAGTATLAVLVVERLAGHAGTTPLSVQLDEPPATRIAASASTGEQLTLLLQGGGPDRVVVIDLRSGRVRDRVALGR